ncbi:hypothetical protein AURDEDRAFT_123917 [Auricularia subglabra TFB-10046 SS5]|nr:hypothetical protein AURDEDRAFT_123917 [Auricularia subglabra TFB-10046 SS5]
MFIYRILSTLVLAALVLAAPMPDAFGDGETAGYFQTQRGCLPFKRGDESHWWTVHKQSAIRPAPTFMCGMRRFAARAAVEMPGLKLAPKQRSGYKHLGRLQDTRS